MQAHEHILLVEDDDVDVMTVRRALKELGAPNPLDLVSDGEQALAFLRDPANARPGLILLDLNMPRMNGVEFLVEVHQDPALKSIPVVVLTTSQLETDRVASFNQCVAGYMVKPVDYPQFVKTMRVIRDYWATSASSTSTSSPSSSV
jgi:CheY-like chemotaxis protein